MRPTTIESFLISYSTGQWFTWSDPSNKVYSNLKLNEKVGKNGELINNPITELPTEKECTDGLAALQAAWDLENNSYKSQRQAEYPSVVDQLDKMFHSGFQAWKDEIQKVKDKYPKP